MMILDRVLRSVSCCVSVVALVFLLSVTADDYMKKETTDCKQLCFGDYKAKGCKYSEESKAREEVVVITNDPQQMESWDWDTISMVLSPDVNGALRSQAGCITHTKGKRFGVIESVPSNITQYLDGTLTAFDEFKKLVKAKQKLFNADNLVFDLLDFFTKLATDQSTALNITLAHLAMTSLGQVLSNTKEFVTEIAPNNNVLCIVPWEPVCEDGHCTAFQTLLLNCDILLLSPDSYVKPTPDNGNCTAGPTLPLTKFLYGIDRYVSLRVNRESIIAGIPWHGYQYNCDDLDPKTDKCILYRSKASSPLCFDGANRKRMSLSLIHHRTVSSKDVKMDFMNRAIYYSDKKMQVWYDNFTTMHIKYQLVKDIKLRGLSIWYGEDLNYDPTNADDISFAIKNWNFLTHNILHKTVFKPVKHDTHTANTVAAVGVGCLLLGTVLGVVFACIAFRRSNLRRKHQPFKLDGAEDEFRDDEGL